MSAQILITLIIVGCAAAAAASIFLLKSPRSVQSETSSLVKWTIVIAVASWGGVAVATWSVWQLRADLREVVSATISFNLDKEFDSDEIRRARREMAKELLAGKANLAEMRVLDFFEKVATYQRLDRVDAYTVGSSFSYFVERYWIASKGFIANFRKSQNDDAFFADFERLNGDMLARDAEEKHRKISQVTPPPAEVQRFLREESTLP